MAQLSSTFVRSARRNLGVVAAMFCVITVAHVEATAVAEDVPIGRIDFEAADLPTANVEVDLSQAMFKDLFGIGDAAIAGAVEAILNSAQGKGESHNQNQIIGEQLEAARQIVQIVSGVVREVRVRAYEGLPKGVEDPTILFKPFDSQLKVAKWETIVRVRQDEQVVRVSVLRSDGAIRGIFVTATDGDAIVLGNVVCELSPENVRKLTAAATRIGIESNFKPKFEFSISHDSKGEEPAAFSVGNVRPATPATHAMLPKPPTPPSPPKVLPSVVQ